MLFGSQHLAWASTGRAKEMIHEDKHSTGCLIPLVTLMIGKLLKECQAPLTGSDLELAMLCHKLKPPANRICSLIRPEGCLRFQKQGWTSTVVIKVSLARITIPAFNTPCRLTRKSQED